MEVLDDLEKIRRLDKQDMLGVEENFYNQLNHAKDIARSAKISSLEGRSFAGIAVLGMGGSGFSGDIIKSLILDRADMPVEVVKSYDLPFFVKEGWLVIAVSYSGNTEETINALKQALLRKCELLAVSAGGAIKEIAEKNSKCHVALPGGYQPRGASGYLFFTTLLLLDRLKIISIAGDDIEEALNLIKIKTSIYNRQAPAESNPAKKLAVQIYDRLPVIYGVSGYLSAVAYRWKCEINENAKCPAFWGEFPEINHNETVGWQNLDKITEKMVLIVFKDDAFSEKIKVRIDTTVGLVRGNFDDVIEIKAEGSSGLAKALSVMYLGDIASVYLAFLYDTDPTPVDRIAVLKAQLSKLDK
ncbi:MAG: bifunctional phosphoglucose/phosphomannose isomerase [Actinobacteria bacterium]|nr:bifunctional phosphoglucose/phosphomannose isomerase [Actinomycetota bacterium]